jgi:holo-[acyl-carrier protein] synthase
MIGVDIIDIKRFRSIVHKDFNFWNKFYSTQEWEYCFSKSLSSASLAAIFAAKEAVMKALGGKYIGHFELIEIGHLKSGKPVVFLKGKDIVVVEVSLSHTDDYAAAVAVVS